ncbi:MAG: tetratricopeptide repeat protein [Candidatus Desantisbacteria bacterium]
MIKIRLLVLVMFFGMFSSSWAGAEDEKSIDELQAELNLSQVKLKKISDQKDVLSKEYNACVVERDKNAENIKQLTTSINQKEDEKAKIQQNAKKEIDGIKKQLQDAMDEGINMQTQLKEKIQGLKDKSAEIVSLKEGLSKEKDQSATGQKDLQSQQVKLQAEIDSLKTSLKERENTITNVKGQLTTLENQMKETTVVLEKYKADEAQATALKEKLDKEKNSLEQSIQETNKKKEEMVVLNNQLMMKLNQLKQGIVPEEIKKEQNQKYIDYVKRLNSMKLKGISTYCLMELSMYVTNCLELEKSDEIQYLVGQLYEEEKRFDEAAIAYAKLICIWPDGSFVSKGKGRIRDLEKLKKIDKEFSQKILAISVGGEKKEERWLNYIKQLFPVIDASLYSCLDHELDEFLRCYSYSPMAFDAYQTKAQNLLKVKQQEYLAIAAYIKVIYLYPNIPQIAQVYFEIGRIFDIVKDYPNAASFYQDGVARFPDDANAPKYLLESARIWADKLKDNDKAIKAYETIVAAYSKSEQSPAALFELGKIFEQLKRYEQVISVYNRIVKEYPQSPLSPSALITIGECYEKISDYEQAADSYFQLYQKYPKDSHAAEILYRAGQLQEDNLNNSNKAIEIYQLVLKDFAENQYAKKAEARIKKLTK